MTAGLIKRALFSFTALAGLGVAFQNCSSHSGGAAASQVTSASTLSTGSTSAGVVGTNITTPLADATQSKVASIDDMYLESANPLSSSPVTGYHMHLFATAGFQTYASQQWPNGVIPVAFDPSLKAGQIAMFRAACAEWGSVSSVTCIDRTSETNYVQVSSPSANTCASDVGAGLQGGMRRVYLGSNCWSYATVLHEIGHVLGFMHEHQRPDRDQYINVHMQNVIAGDEYALAVFTKDVTTHPYDFASIMHYASHAFSKNGLPTMTVKQAYLRYSNVMGLSQHLSDLDQQSASEMYPIPIAADDAGDDDSSLAEHMVYRYIDDQGHHLFANGDDDSVPDGFQVEGPLFMIYDQPSDGLQPLYRCVTGYSNLLSLDPGCEDSDVVNVIGYVGTDENPGITTPLYRFDANGDYLVNTDSSEADGAGYGDEAPLGYVPM